jgi:predicted dinucleotide-binding enzyme
MTEISVLGAGRVGASLGNRLAVAGHKITFGTRQPAVARGNWAGPPVNFASAEDAVLASTVVTNTTPGETTLDLLSGLKQALVGRTLIDVTNAIDRGPEGKSVRLLYPDASLAELLQEALPDSHVVKTLNTMLFRLMIDPASAGTVNPPTAFLSGDDDEAKTVTRNLLHDLGWPDGWIEDLGDITSARGPEVFMLFVPHLARRYGMVPFGLSLALPR